MAVRSPKRRLARGRVLVVLLLLGLGVSGQVMALDVIDHGIVRSLPPVERLTEVSSTVDSIHSYVAVGPIVDSQHFIWRWFAPDGTLWREDGPVVVGSSGETYAIAPVAQQFLIAEASPPAGDWRVDIQINGMHLVTQRFRIVETTAFAEYGDAPDGQPCGYHKDPGSDAIGRFPTLFASASAQAPGTHGAHVLDTNQVALGSIRLSSRELDADDPLDSDGTPNLVNQDVDDGLAVRFLPTGQIAFDATVSRAVDAPSGTCYVNALYDRNRDGSWNVQPGFAEWILRNVRVDVAPGARQTVNIPVPLESNWVHTLSEPAWLRLAVTSEPIDETGGWDGSGRFAVGEIEDYKIGAASVEDLDQAIRQAHRLASAEAWSHARSISWQLLLAMAQVTELEIKYASATAAVAVAASAQQRAYSFAYDADAAYASATAAASAAASAFASTPCATVSAHASASVQASVSAAASAVAWANASAAAAADAHAAAIAWAESLAVLMPTPRPLLCRSPQRLRTPMREPKPKRRAPPAQAPSHKPGPASRGPTPDGTTQRRSPSRGPTPAHGRRHRPRPRHPPRWQPSSRGMSRRSPKPSRRRGRPWQRSRSPRRRLRPSRTLRLMRWPSQPRRPTPSPVPALRPPSPFSPTAARRWRRASRARCARTPRVRYARTRRARW